MARRRNQRGSSDYSVEVGVDYYLAGLMHAAYALVPP